jgi:flagellar biosynthetic protein FliQ
VTEGQIMDVLREAMLVAFKLAGPLLMVSIVVGLIVSVFQAATQIHEQTLTFVPKIVCIALLLLMMGSWMIGTLGEFIRGLFLIMENL